MTTPWHMARVASRRELPKPRKMMGPVGEREGEICSAACGGCGYHVCSCDPYALYKNAQAAYPGVPIVGWKYMAKGSGGVIMDGSDGVRRIYMSPQNIPPEHRGK